MQNESNDSPAKKNFFTTLPGIITSVAAIITAFTGLIVALNNAGCFKAKTIVQNEAQKSGDNSSTASKESTGKQNSISNENDTSSNHSINVIYTPSSIILPESNTEIKIVGTKAEDIGNNQFLLTLHLKCICNSQYGFVFGSNHFRLQAGEDNYEPVNFFSEAVYNSFKEEDLQFKFPHIKKSNLLLAKDDKLEKVLEFSF